MKAEVIVQRPLTVLVAGSTPTPRWPIIWTRPWHLSDSTRPILPIRSVPFTDVSRSSVICCKRTNLAKAARRTIATRPRTAKSSLRCPLRAVRMVRSIPVLRLLPHTSGPRLATTHTFRCKRQNMAVYITISSLDYAHLQ